MAVPSISDWKRADPVAAELTERIVRGPLDADHIRAVLAAYFAQEAADRREQARRAHPAPGATMTIGQLTEHLETGGCEACRPNQ